MGMPVPTIFNTDTELAARVKTTGLQVPDAPQTVATAGATTQIGALLTTLLTDHNTLVGKYNSLLADHNSLRTTVNDLLAKSRTGGMIAP